MNKLYSKCICILLLALLFSCKKNIKNESTPVQIAFIADAHFQDVYAHFEDADYQGIENPKTGEFANIRTMDAQLKSTRIFNENYFACIAALDDIVARGIKYVALPGDFSDDGQPIHVKGLRKLLDIYTEKHGILFFATTGNHDPVKPFTQDAGKSDFLGVGGQEQIITSSIKNLKDGVEGQLKPIITSEIKKWGYKDILNEMSSFGFYPQPEYRYWETPFSSYAYNEYSFEKAKEASILNKRTYQIDAYNAHPDASYLVEPVAGVWLLAIDANVYVPNTELAGVSNNPNDFSGASIGYNNVLLQKSHLVTWVKKVAEQAKKQGKVLIAFSHYPMVDFNDDASVEMKQFFGDKKMQLHRVPNEEVAQTFADAGIQIHFGGHMHINDTGVRTSGKGNTLFNIQTPSLAAYTPGYKVLTIHSKTDFEVETVVIKSAKNFNSLFPLYEQEYAYLKESGATSIWNKDILLTENYKDFTKFHLKELVRLRFLPNDWPKAFADSLLSSTGKDLLLKSRIEDAEVKAYLKTNDLTLENFENWTGFDMIYDFYKLRSADELAFQDIGVNRLKAYEQVCSLLKKASDERFQLWASIFDKSRHGLPSNHFRINLEANTIERITP
ncbi:metallophosphoesterase [Algibacter miyuki]|uniref:Metallophosphoesterase n=1 Tax=Algibacter miyuki TaxID=1306933 RepID=A0ABV5H4R8_9FLAO|nr:metallophosphoesterase [Algibacter miyuki]MDN3665833.1 metallophosphoesterase [Algibacter miyuki]